MDRSLVQGILLKCVKRINSFRSAGLRTGRSGFYGSISGWGWEFFSTPPRPDRRWGPPSLLSNEYQGLFPSGQSGRGAKLTTHLHPVPRSKNVWRYTSTPQYAFIAWCSVTAQGQLYFPLLLPLPLPPDLGSNLRSPKHEAIRFRFPCDSFTAVHSLSPSGIC
jgi:hypothetical protein